MSLLNANQRAFVAADTGIERLIVDRATEAFDAALKGEIQQYERLMGTAVLQMNYGRPVVESDRPTAVDAVKTILLKALADERRITYPAAVKLMRKILTQT